MFQPVKGPSSGHQHGESKVLFRYWDIHQLQSDIFPLIRPLIYLSDQRS